MDRAEPDQHLPQRSLGRRTLLQHPRPDAARPGPPFRGRRADVPVHLARLRGPVSRDAARHRGADRAARRHLPHHPPAPRRLRPRAVAALARPRNHLPAAGPAHPALGHRAQHARRRLCDLRDLQFPARQRVRRRLCRTERTAAARRDHHSAPGAGRAAAAAATAANRGRDARPDHDHDEAAPVPRPRDQAGPRRRAGRRAVDHRAADQPQHVRLRVGRPEFQLPAADPAHRRGAERRKGRRPGQRLHRQPADPHRAVPLQLAAFPGARRRGGEGARAAHGRSKRVKAVGKGDADPIAPNTTPDGRQANRRTEIVVVKTAVAL